MLLSLGALAVSTDEFTESSERHCTDGDCTLTLYSGVRFVNEDSTWKPIEDAISLKDYYSIKYLQNDGVHDFEVVDFNYTSVTFNVFVTDSKELNKDIPFKVDGVQKSTEKLFSLSGKSTVTYTSPNIFASNYTFGTASTTIQLQDADTENLDDAEVDQFNPDTNFGSGTGMRSRRSDGFAWRSYIKFNITAVPAGVTIDDAVIWFSGSSVVGGHQSAGGRTVGVYNVSFTQWDEASITWNNEPCGAAFDNSDNCTLTAEDSHTESSGTQHNLTLSVTKMVTIAYDRGDFNISMVVKDNPEQTGGQVTKWDTKEFADVNRRPYLNISYTPDLVPQFSTVINNGTLNNTVANWTVTVTDDTELSFCWFTHNVSGSFVNESVQSCITPEDLSFNITIIAPQDSFICGFFGANDSVNQHNQSANSCFTVSPSLLNGSLDVTLNTMTTRIISQSTTFVINATVRCEGGNCSFVTGTPYFNWTGPISTEVNNSIGDIPLYNVSELINQTCNTDLADGQTCSTGWTISVTGAVGTFWQLTINFTTSNTLVLTNGTIITTLSIVQLPPVHPIYRMCDEPNVNIGRNCTFVTPALNCSIGDFTYDIVNLSGIKVVDNGSLANLQGNLYFFNFTQVDGRNDFVVRLCDDTTREVRVRGGDENMTNIAIAILLGVMIFALAKFGIELDEKHWTIKLALFGTVIGLGYGVFNLSVKFAEDLGASTNVVGTLNAIFLGYTYLAILVYAYIMIRIIIWAVAQFKVQDVELKSEQDEEEFDKGW